MRWYEAFFLSGRTARRMNELTERLTEADAELARLRGEVDRMRCTVMTHRETELIQARRLGKLEGELAERDARIREMESSIEEATVDREEYDKLVAFIDRFEEEKSKYEQKLQLLRSQLKDAREALRRSVTPDMVDTPAPVDMTVLPTMPGRKPELTDLDSPAERRPDDWLQQLPDTLK